MSEEENIPNQKSEEKPAGGEQSQPEPQPETLDLPAGQAGVEPQTTNMETHAHHLHKAPGKNFWHYFFEFFMLFLAVFCGFLAENQREHWVERQRERQFIRSLREDLKSDTSQLNFMINQRQKAIMRIDSLFYYLRMPDPDNYGKYVYYYARNIINRFLFYSNDRTIQQLKNGGNLRLIQNQAVSDSLMRYDWFVRRTEAIKDREEAFMRDYIEAVKQVLDGGEFNNMKISQSPIPLFAMPEDNPPLVRKDRESIQNLINNLYFLKSMNAFNMVWNKDLIDRGSKLLKQLKNEYHLKDE